ncbi:3-oxoacyl-ACP reductase FabG [Francisella adeliensis]|uniref:3-oxoacyl-[acyl-carrier-protein] reductase n=1 Tax=Francisella adeliensis TaxID=2007306 RepID=A0A2Z4Y0N5_9GAMM|nr:3-oxoacyl-ACP reductase FabG [Francisella adeliensis]AXA34292.1 3-oxoacyl-ACP reductase [Francisella adeliensis]MBK2084935.1 3-oxoacyl-ACP reductase FabG [Francisella adeliensis]MBK2096234.1 3-oxoacyl-ACP reductase FabG [Francisella adeliensis]QIW12537.1 3-oxoacyl-ACP reductase FabG [Francisella adeliensis]QIW14410.1 3-oxoacyl-ACP reductase FabG [Francisella adeliensis]
MSLNKKTVLITGASRGIGNQVALTMAEKGAFVIGTATSQASAEKFEQNMAEKGFKAKGMVLNISDAESIKNLFSELKTEKLAIDILVNNAGITRDNLMMRMSDDEWNSVINTNLSSIFKISKECIRGMMKKRWGRIISIGSVVASAGNPGQANYCAAKAGVIGFSKSLAYETSTRGITVNVVAPGFIATDMTDKLTDEQKSFIATKIPSGQMGEPKDIAEAVAFLASDGARYITGQTIHVNGGMYMA